MVQNNCILELIEQFTAVPQSQPAFEIYDGTQVTSIPYPMFAEDILRSAGFFVTSGISGKHIALIGPNSYAWLVSFLAITASGNVAVPMNFDLPGTILLQQCQGADISLICGDEAFFSDLSQVFPCYAYSQIRGSSVASLSEFPTPRLDDTAVMLYTSGTTGESKIAVLSHANLLSSLRSPDGAFTAPDTHRTMSVLPLFHISGLRGSLAMLCRHKVLCIGRGPMHLFQDMAALSPSYVLLVPMMVESLVKLLKHLPQEEVQKKYLGKQLKRICVGGASVNPEVCRFLMEHGFTIDSGYGMTETTGVGTWGQWDAAHHNTIGILSSELQCRIAQDGELLFKGPAVMEGYYKAPAATAAAITDGWLHSGDLGYCDTDGYYYITGRKKELIVLSNGEKLNPTELESYFKTCTAVLDCRVFGSGNTICMEVYTANPEEVKLFLKQYHCSMPRAFHIHRVTYHSKPLERTSTGKIIRREHTT